MPLLLIKLQAPCTVCSYRCYIPKWFLLHCMSVIQTIATEKLLSFASSGFEVEPRRSSLSSIDNDSKVPSLFQYDVNFEVFLLQLNCFPVPPVASTFFYTVGRQEAMSLLLVPFFPKGRRQQLSAPRCWQGTGVRWARGVKSSGGCCRTPCPMLQCKFHPLSRTL